MPSLSALIIGLAFGILKDFGLEKSGVGIGSLVEELRPLGVEFEGGLEEFQSLFDLHRRLVAAQSRCIEKARSADLDFLSGVILLVDVVLGLDVDGRESGLQTLHVSDVETTKNGQSCCRTILSQWLEESYIPRDSK